MPAECIRNLQLRPRDLNGPFNNAVRSHKASAYPYFSQQKSITMNLIEQSVDLARNPKHTRWLSPLLLILDAALCGLIIWKVHCLWYLAKNVRTSAKPSLQTPKSIGKLIWSKLRSISQENETTKILKAEQALLSIPLFTCIFTALSTRSQIGGPIFS